LPEVLSYASGRRRGALLAATTCIVLGASVAAEAQSAKTRSDGKRTDVQAINKSEPTLCAEHDNVQIDLKSADVRHFSIEAHHPAYIATITKERAAFDLTHCTFRQDAFVPATPRKKTFWESKEFWLTGYTFDGFWRANDVPVRVGNTVERGFHMVQLWMLHRERAEEIMVFYPPDGYWRARPLPFEDMRWTAYGSSFLVGPVEVQKRPLVRLKEIAFDPQTRTFKLQLMRGGHASLTLKAIDQKHISLDVALSQDVPRDTPFASLRSMYVTETNSDVARLAWRRLNGKRWHEASVMDLKQTALNHLWAGRRIPSQHNLSAPDFVFRNFESAPIPIK